MISCRCGEFLYGDGESLNHQDTVRDGERKNAGVKGYKKRE